MSNVTLYNADPSRSMFSNLCYPRLQANKKGEIILALSKEGLLTRGILVGYTDQAANKKIPIGTYFADWEVAGPLTDYNGEVSVTFKNEFPAK
jgi:hypothetical protein